MPPQLTVLPPSITIPVVQAGTVTQQQLAIYNSGGGALDFTIAASGGVWLAASAVSGRATSGIPSAVTLTITPQSLTPGTYHGQIVIRTPDGSQSATVPVTLTVNEQTQSIVLTQTGLQFTALAQGVSPPAQSFVVLNGGDGTMNWTAAGQTVSGGNWMVVSPASGASIAGAATNAAVSVSVDTHNLFPGLYYGVVRVTAPSAGNSPQLVSVVLAVLAPGETAPPLIPLVGLLPVGLVGGADATDTTTLYNLTTQTQSFSSTVSTEDGGSWLIVSPANGTLPAAGSTLLTVKVASTGLSAGVRHGVVRLAFSDGSVRTLTVVSVLAPASVNFMASAVEPTAGCTTSSLALTLQSLEPGFAVLASQAVPIQVKVVDNCGSAITKNVTVTMSFTTKDATATLVPGNGTWSATWTPHTAGSGVGLLITAFAVQGANVMGAQLLLTGTVRTALNTSAASPVLIANSASYLSPGQITPGSWVSIFGERMADGTELAGTVPFPNALNGTQVSLGDIALPLLYVSATQVNALIPYSLSVSANHPLLVQRNGTSSVPLDVTVADLLPAVYTANQQGVGQGAILIANTGLLAAPVGAYAGARPVRRGEFVEIYASGLGPVLSTPADGAPAPKTPPLATTVLTPTITVGGVPVTNILYSGLAPGQVGLYQINIQVPDAAPTGDAVPVAITIGGNAANTVTMAVSAAQ
jgi:uncharacterized protein (TIGR03437 family)